MRPVEDFMHEFFHARTVEEQREMASRAPFRQKYFADECQADSRSHKLAMIQSEEVVDLTQSDSEAVVITVYKNPFYKPSNQMKRKRYHLKPAGDSWLIQFVETECPFCHGVGDENCRFCKGKHWRRGGRTAEERESDDKG
jgi:hypothetical protein